MYENAGKRVVLLEFTGKEASSGKVFDTTSEEEAKAHGFYSENSTFKPIPVIVGHGDILPSLDNAVAEMKEGEARTLRLAPENAFGNRRQDLIVIVPVQQFLSRKIRPVPGLIVDLNGALGRVQTVSGGRVRIDLNNDLAGKEVEYKLRIAKELVSAEEKCQRLAEKFFPLRGKNVETRLENGKLFVKLPKEIAGQLGQLVPAFTKTIREVEPEIKEVEIAETIEEKAGKKPMPGQEGQIPAKAQLAVQDLPKPEANEVTSDDKGIRYRTGLATDLSTVQGQKGIAVENATNAEKFLEKEQLQKPGADFAKGPGVEKIRRQLIEETKGKKEAEKPKKKGKWIIA